jgi:guanosine-3',5'-bis(diphosphate) 3'-pyrophosphohydrolase
MKDINCWEQKFDSCVYSDRLLGKLLKLNEKAKNKINIIEIKKAIYYAKKYHGDQKRDSGEPYYSHPLEVAFNVADYCFKTDILVTSVLHDVIEDTVLSEKMIEYIFDPIIANQVEALTRIKPDRKVKSAEIAQQLFLEKKEDLLIVKLCDRLHNMQTLGAKSEINITKISEETAMSFLILNIFLADKFPKMLILEQQLTNLIYKYLNIVKQHYLKFEESDYADNFQLVFPGFQNGTDPNST